MSASDNDNDLPDLANDYLNTRMPAIVSATDYALMRIDLELAIKLLIGNRRMLINLMQLENMAFLGLANWAQSLGKLAEAIALHRAVETNIGVCAQLSEALAVDMQLAAKYGIEIESSKWASEQLL